MKWSETWTTSCTPPSRVARTPWSTPPPTECLAGDSSMPRHNISSGTSWEPVVGYSRAVRVGPLIFVAGTTATGPDGAIVGVGDPYAQAVQALRNVERALVQAGARPRDGGRTRLYVTRIEGWGAVGGGPGGVFPGIRPTST